MAKRDADFLIKLEKAIEEKFGKETSQNIKSKWTLEKEREFLIQAKKLYLEKMKTEKEPEFEEIENGVLIQKHLLINDNSCPKCQSFSFNADDDFFITRYGCCEVCFIKFVEGREKDE